MRNTLRKYIKRVWYLTAIPVVFFVIASTIIKEIFTGDVDNDGWCYWK